MLFAFAICLVSAFVGMFAFLEDKLEVASFFKRTFIKTASIGLAISLAGIFVPSERTAALIAASEIGGRVVETVGDVPSLGKDASDLLRLTLRKESARLREEIDGRGNKK